MNLMPLRSTAPESYDLARGLIQDPCEPGYNYWIIGCQARGS